jgi:hypothetical protein
MNINHKFKRKLNNCQPYTQLEFFPLPDNPQISSIPLSGKIAQQQAIFQKPQKLQVESIPGVSPKERNRYQVRLGDKAIASELTCDDAAKLANLIKRKRLTPAIEFLEQRGICSEEAQVFLLSAIGGEG